MTRRAPRPLPPPTAEVRDCARVAAQALRAATADPTLMGARIVARIDLARPRRGEWWESWANLPGFWRINGPRGRYCHQILLGWTYARSEIWAEMIPDLEALAEQGARPTGAISGAAA